MTEERRCHVTEKQARPSFQASLFICQGFPGPRGEKGDRSERGEKVRAREEGDGASRKGEGGWTESWAWWLLGPGACHWGVGGWRGPKPGNHGYPTVSFLRRGSEGFLAGKE